MARRKTNPALGTLLLVGATAAAVVGGIGYAVVQARKSKSSKKKKINCETGYEPRVVNGIEVCMPIGAPAPKVHDTTNKPGKYVGASGYSDWPYKQRYPTPGSFITALKALGYTPGSSITDSKSKSAIQAFQRDFNTVTANTKSWMWDIFTDQDLDSDGIRRLTETLGLGTIGVDGRLGDQTINALVAAIGLSDGVELPWRSLASLKKSDLSPSGKVELDDEFLIVEDGQDMVFPSPKSGLVGGECPSLVREVVLEYMAGNGNAEGAVEYILDECGSDPEAKRLAILSYIIDVAEANSGVIGTKDLRDYALASM